MWYSQAPWLSTWQVGGLFNTCAYNVPYLVTLEEYLYIPMEVCDLGKPGFDPVWYKALHYQLPLQPSYQPLSGGRVLWLEHTVLHSEIITTSDQTKIQNINTSIITTECLSTWPCTLNNKLCLRHVVSWF